ncbi:MAG: type II secretion system ATPase GspE [Deltaproteobacteria bacterium]|nr:type II secretion system ATPase GspE [Deltaproteobacteria bacterium]MBW1957218.1 type II secretion system ATPase GspE [Deltaproteobacteria bacterium]MBW2088408.1 type II secretion system ATPase GspE [Deltaproteobacteria bacterium]MBW2320787.1 type II secretion system ATPase GspE [Deltaproteobacteria bacterium]
MQKPLTQILKETFGVSEEDLKEAQKIKTEKGDPLGEILVAKKTITETQRLEALSIQYDIPFWPDLPLDSFKTDFISQVPIQFLKKYVMVPLISDTEASDVNHSLPQLEPENATKTLPDSVAVIALNDPACIQPLDDLIRILEPYDFKLVLSTKDAILFAINISYDLSRDSAEQLVQDMEEDSSAIISEIEEKADLLDDISDAPIIKLVNHIISQSVKARASDIHMEPYRDSFKVRYRVDGILYDLLSPPKWVQPALISRIKVMAKMNIAEKRLPQDGRFDVKIGNQEIDVRISTIPTSFGERLVLRLLDKSGSLISFSDLGLASDKLDLLENLVRFPNGIMLVTGPTGSGKTTTLYAILSSINIPDINIITIEDPVEYQIKGISQIQVNPKINLTFAAGLRSIVRQDPDVILVGEIRDRETAEIAVQSALTGHLVFSTLHTNDSASAITRLVDIGVEPFLISSSVLAVVAQRLVRVLCRNCKQPYTPDNSTLKSIGITPDQFQETTIYRANGCENCFHTGYRGRTGIFEIMLLDSSLKSLILTTYDSSQIKNAALNLNMVTLRQDGIQKVLRGISTIEEIIRVTQQ